MIRFDLTRYPNSETTRSKGMQKLNNTSKAMRNDRAEQFSSVLPTAGHRERTLPGEHTRIGTCRTPVADEVLTVDDVAIEDDLAETLVALLNM